jgi:hypothetical protein
MLARPLLGDILTDEGLTRGLGDPEARVLVEWLVEQADHLAGCAPAEAEAGVRRLCRRGRAISCFVRLWCYEGSRRSAIQLAAVERFGWPLPTRRHPDPCELMQGILAWETKQRAAEAAVTASRARPA